MSLSGSGEPTLSPLSITKTLTVLKENELYFDPINLYSNGILLGQYDFADKYLPQWVELGLSNIYLTVHDVDEKENARVYVVRHYPHLKTIISNVKNNNLGVRANIIISRDIISGLDKLKCTCESLFELGVDAISAWPIRKLDDTLDCDKLPSDINKMKQWADNNGVRLLLEDSKKDYASGDKLTLFPNGVLSNTWCS